MVGAETGILVQKMGESLHHEGRTDQQNESQRHFQNNKRIAESRRASDTSTSSFFQRFVGIHSRAPAPRRQAKNHTGYHPPPERTRQDPPSPPAFPHPRPSP